MQTTHCATALLANTGWLAALPRAMSSRDKAKSAVRDARTSLMEGWLAFPTPERAMLNQAEYQAGQRAAARWAGTLAALKEILAEAAERIPDLDLASKSESDLAEMAEVEANAWRSALRAAHHSGASLEMLLVSVMTLHGDDDELPGIPITPSERRAMCPRAQLRLLRKRASAARQHAAAIFGSVGSTGHNYADTYTLARWEERQASAAAFASGKVLVTSSGKELPMSEIMTSSKKAALARLYAMAKGMDDTAKREGWAAAFLTLTLPAEYHPAPANGGEGYDPSLSPAVADQALGELVARLRARMKKAGVPSFGLCVKEPHRDGCPHAHILAYMPEDDINRVDTMLQQLRPEPVDGQRIATRCVRIDRARAAPTTYIFKYLAKSLSTDLHPQTEMEGDDGDHLAQHRRVRAWASERGLRRWAVWGAHGVQRVWQALHQRKNLPEGTPEQVISAWKAIAEHRYGDALTGLGA